MEPRISNLEILRKRLRIVHQDPLVRRLQTQYEVKNSGEVPEEELFFILTDPLPRLRVTTGSGEEVSYLSADMVSEKVGDPEAFIQEAVGDEAYEAGDFSSAHLLWIGLEEPLDPNGFLVLRFDHRDVVSPPYSKGLVQEPLFNVREEKRYEGYDTIVEVQGPMQARLPSSTRKGSTKRGAMIGTSKPARKVA